MRCLNSRFLQENRAQITLPIFGASRAPLPTSRYQPRVTRDMSNLDSRAPWGFQLAAPSLSLCVIIDAFIANEGVTAHIDVILLFIALKGLN